MHVDAPTPNGFANGVDSALALLHEAARLAPAVFSTSFGAEDMVVLDLIRQSRLDIAIITLDTGRLSEPTYSLMHQVQERYGPCFETLYPDPKELSALVQSNGVNGFYASVENRKACCSVRKVKPLARALWAKRAWVTGLRAQQAITRSALQPREYDVAYCLEKFNPLFDWTEAQVWDYLRANAVPYNALHDQGYPSIGCAPCTRAITRGEDSRAGRWWWEAAETKECGLHRTPRASIPIRELA
jgi:phosphoadenosine phosphosulfate reductase